MRGIVALVLLACFICPILEMFDRWDHTLQTGQDTESTFVILALCSGAVISFWAEEGFVVPLQLDARVSLARPIFVPNNAVASFAVQLPAISASPPALRI